MRFPSPIEIHSQQDEVFAVASYKDPALSSRKQELLTVGESPPVQLMHARCVQPEPARYLGRPGRQILIQKKPQRLPRVALRATRAGERELLVELLGPPVLLLFEARLYLLGVEPVV